MAFLSAGGAVRSSEAARPDRPVSPPPRAKDASGGRALSDRLARGPLDAAAQVQREELFGGNLPSFLRRWVPVDFSRERDGSVLGYVLPDYLAIGDDRDFAYARLAAFDAQRIATRWKCHLPTPFMVDAIFRAAQFRFAANGLVGRSQVDWRRQAQKYDARLMRQRRQHVPEPENLVAGHLKDIVATPARRRKPYRVAIYGMHQRSGRATQPLSLYHRLDYVDYSHGVRLVSDRLRVDGKERSLRRCLERRDCLSHLSAGVALPLPSYPSRCPQALCG
ncbi:MAG: hypothetical protein AAGA56_26090 [Myxococcota bacterium]